MSRDDFPIYRLLILLAVLIAAPALICDATGRVGDPPNNSDKPVPAPVQNYAVIDLSGTLPGTADKALVADDGHVVFDIVNDDYTCETIYKWSNGTLIVTGTVNAAAVTSTNSSQQLYLNGILTTAGDYYTTGFVYTATLSGSEMTIGGGQVIGSSFGFLYAPAPYTTSTDGSGPAPICGGVVCASTSGYTSGIYGPGYPDRFWPSNYLTASGSAVEFDPQMTVFSSGSSTVVHQCFGPFAMNSQGCAIGGDQTYTNDSLYGYLPISDPDTLLWNGSNLNITVHGGVALNDQTYVLEDTGTGDSLWIPNASLTSGSNYDIDASIAKTFGTQITNIYAMFLSNTDSQGTAWILLNANSLQNDGSTPSQTFVLGVSSTSTYPDFRQMQLPIGTGITNYGRSTDSNEASYPTINSGGVIAATGTFPGQGDPQALLLLPVELAVDGNHDGTISLSGSGGSDQTTADKPYKFWINNNHDGYCSDSGETSVQDDLQPGEPDSSNNIIQCTRDLEDLTRLWINFGTSATLIKGMIQNGFSVGLQWEPIPGDTTDPTPTIKIFDAVETDGSTGYVFDSDTANSQISNGYGVALTDTSYSNYIVGSTPFIVPSIFWSNVDNTHPKYLLFEGVTAGKGKLVLVFFDANGNKIGEGGAVYMDLRDIKNMYERWSCEERENQNGGVPAPQALPSSYRLPSGSQPFSYQKNDPETSDYILYTHGWNMQTWEKDAYAETAFKRLWWQGYKGRFGAFQWPTTYNSIKLDAITGFDNGEYTAWKSSVPLEHLLSLLNKRYPGTVYAYAHSMGNVAVGEALRRAAQDGSGQVEADYLASQAAIPVHCYDPSQSTPSDFFDSFRYEGYLVLWVDPIGPETPNIYPNWMSSIGAGALSNFYNVNDYALSHTVWETDQALKPDFGSGLNPPYGFTGDINASPVQDGFYNHQAALGISGRIPNLHLGTAADVKDRYEIMAFASEPRCRALGATSNAAGFGSTNMQSLWPSDPFETDPTKLYSDHPWHSAQFRFTNADQHSYWFSALFQLTGQTGNNP